MAMDDALDLAHFKTLLEQRAAELDRLLEDAESRSQSVELDQSKVGVCREWMHSSSKQ